MENVATFLVIAVVCAGAGVVGYSLHKKVADRIKPRNGNGVTLLYRIVISERKNTDSSLRDRDIFDAIFDATEIDINRVRRVIVDGPTKETGETIVT